MSELRKCFVLKEVEMTMPELKKGDVFRVDPIDGTDVINIRGKWKIALTDAKSRSPAGNCSLQIGHVKLILDKDLEFNSKKATPRAVEAPRP